MKNDWEKFLYIISIQPLKIPTAWNLHPKILLHPAPKESIHFVFRSEGQAEPLPGYGEHPIGGLNQVSLPKFDFEYALVGKQSVYFLLKLSVKPYWVILWVTPSLELTEQESLHVLVCVSDPLLLYYSPYFWFPAPFLSLLNIPCYSPAPSLSLHDKGYPI